jgi:hypothetical protein
MAERDRGSVDNNDDDIDDDNNKSNNSPFIKMLANIVDLIQATLNKKIK